MLRVSCKSGCHWALNQVAAVRAAGGGDSPQEDSEHGAVGGTADVKGQAWEARSIFECPCCEDERHAEDRYENA
jgi:hypothetical protein